MQCHFLMQSGFNAMFCLSLQESQVLSQKTLHTRLKKQFRLIRYVSSLESIVILCAAASDCNFHHFHYKAYQISSHLM